MLTSQEVYQEVRRRGNPNIGAKSNQVHPDTAATPVRPTDPNTELAEDDTAEVLDSPQDRRSHVDNCSPLSEGKQDAHPSLRREPAHPNQTIENNCTSIQPSTSLAKHEANSNSARQPEESCTRLNTMQSYQINRWMGRKTFEQMRMSLTDLFYMESINSVVV
jgi:hypothetical protein